MSIPFNYLFGLACVGAILVAIPPGQEPSRGVEVLLGRACPSGRGDGRDIVVRYLPGDQLWLNERAMREEELRITLVEVMSRRVERLVWIAPDERVPYGDVVRLISQLKIDTPRLYTAILTKKQIGPVDPVEIEQEMIKNDGQRPLRELPCVFVKANS